MGFGVARVMRNARLAVYRNPITMKLDFYFDYFDPTGVSGGKDVKYAKPIEFGSRELNTTNDPFLTLDEKEDAELLLGFMNSLWDAGIRPTRDISPESQILKAKNDHLTAIQSILDQVLPSALRK